MTNKFICRGISKETGGFVYGYYLEVDDKKYIFTKETQCIYSDTTESVIIDGLGAAKYGEEKFFGFNGFKKITQEPDRWTGLKDKNDKPIYENDILKIEILYPNENFLVKYNTSKGGWFYRDKCLREDNGKFTEIIGTIHFNKELLEVEK